MDRRRFLQTSAATAAILPDVARGRSLGTWISKKGRTPVILATDIGGDIDDTWALGLLIKCPELDLKLAVTDYGNTEYRGRLMAKFLATTGHGDIPIGLGPDNDDRFMPQAAWVGDYQLADYKGTVHRDGAKAMVDVIMQSPEPVTVIAVGPPLTVAAALALEPKIAQRARLVAMQGSIRLGVGGSERAIAEGNVMLATKAAQQMLSAPWDITITPLDTCGLVVLDGERYQKLLKSRDLVLSAVMANYRTVSKAGGYDADRRSSILFDTVAIYLAMTTDLCVMEDLAIRVTDDGFTRIDDTGKAMKVATSWKDLDAFKEFVVKRLISKR